MCLRKYSKERVGLASSPRTAARQAFVSTSSTPSLPGGAQPPSGTLIELMLRSKEENAQPHIPVKEIHRQAAGFPRAEVGNLHYGRHQRE